jgi:hypothetical protein
MSLAIITNLRTVIYIKLDILAIIIVLLLDIKSFKVVI